MDDNPKFKHNLLRISKEKNAFIDEILKLFHSRLVTIKDIDVPSLKSSGNSTTQYDLLKAFRVQPEQFLLIKISLTQIDNESNRNNIFLIRRFLFVIHSNYCWLSNPITRNKSHHPLCLKLELLGVPHILVTYDLLKVYTLFVCSIPNQTQKDSICPG
ncbi:unnamed protein product (macronuclear) [Paramecium tetraurelia]|uniref:Uncharacterized protein n=1 Tax=Paramecium tetraurelia TaxID=5888 RepID=A0BFM4_PARTE|nr:uncharacterized protein GSPATT00028376001 [Paramecium tetraurelia]CAK57341.1 unnamed protein product [Paramecium tetraurelia]|eukprot:XP_001424739.1 hypothetical protein (macronuclear) [Paramecium tetraurelia strain d4-2]